ncbi:cupredoxin domain-containing protein [Ilumatobacter nonamiensis]|uniref:cupredoxin domain-containing protein n=1 Tax=Ilumatobacter nonamiensis TaxID=467093 RepID=UPI00034DA48A|nr:plastocyanin/azurin family copper-binding protein [Ilumatobacter nonamiensis]
MTHGKLSTLLASTAVVVGLAACSGSDSDSTSSPASEAPSSEAVDSTPDTSTSSESGTDASDAASAGPAVNLERSRFEPAELEVSVGDTVTFTNSDAFAHTVTANDGEDFEFDSGEFGESETFEMTFDEAGSVAYFCQIHPTMRGTITVS